MSRVRAVQRPTSSQGKVQKPPRSASAPPRLNGLLAGSESLRPQPASVVTVMELEVYLHHVARSRKSLAIPVVYRARVFNDSAQHMAPRLDGPGRRRGAPSPPPGGACSEPKAQPEFAVNRKVSGYRRHSRWSGGTVAAARWSLLRAQGSARVCSQSESIRISTA